MESESIKSNFNLTLFKQANANLTRCSLRAIVLKVTFILSILNSIQATVIIKLTASDFRFDLLPVIHAPVLNRV